MLPSTLDLLLYSQSFEKKAGVLRVPEDILNKSQSYVRGSYCDLMLKKLAKLTPLYKKRNATAAMARESYSMWEDGILRLEELLEKEHSYETLREVAAVAASGNFPRIPRYVVDKDPETKLIGYFIGHQSSFLFMFNITSDGIAVDCAVQAPSDKYKLVQYKSNESEMMDITSSFEWLTGIVSIIRDGLDNLSRFLQRMEEGDLSETKQLKAALIVEGKGHEAGSDRFIGTMIDIPITSFPYQRAYLPNSIDKISFALNIVDRSRARDMENDSSWYGLWQEENLIRNMGYIGTISIQIDPDTEFNNLKNDSWSTESLSSTLHRLDDTTRHELQHLVQTFLEWNQSDRTTNKKTDLRGGVPPQITNRNYTALGVPLSVPLAQQEHALRDIEFQTDLSDSISEFKQYASKIPLSLRRPFAMVWMAAVPPESFGTAVRRQSNKPNEDQARSVGLALDKLFEQGSFFSVLKANDFEKWKLAVRELSRHL